MAASPAGRLTFMTTIYTDADADLAALTGRTVAVLGYGNQGHAQAQCLRAAQDVQVLVGARSPIGGRGVQCAHD